MTIKFGVRYAKSRDVEDNTSEWRLRGDEMSFRNIWAMQKYIDVNIEARKSNMALLRKKEELNGGG